MSYLILFVNISIIVTYKPPNVDGSTLPSWVKLPVETHEPNTSGTPMKETSTNIYSPTLMTSKPTTAQNPSDNDIIMTSNSINTNYSSMPNPSSTPSILTTTDSAEAENAPLNMSNYKDGNY